MKKSSARNVLAANLTDLRKTCEPKSNRALAALAGVGEGTVGRARRGDCNVTVDNVDRIARAYHLEAWQLLIKGGVALRPSSDAGGTPQSHEDVEALRSIDVEQLTRVNNIMELPQNAIDIALAWMALPERERNDFRRKLMDAARPYRDHASNPEPSGQGRDSPQARERRPTTTPTPPRATLRPVTKPK